MIKRLSAILLIIVLLFSLSSTAFACNEEQTGTYVTQILFGDNALSRSSDEKVKMLLSAIYLCCEQSDSSGQDKIDYLKLKKVAGIPALSSINIKGTYLLECSHNRWERVFTAAMKSQSKRKKVLQNTVNKVFDFGLFNNLFGSGSGKCNSFAAMLYYSHLLADYLADDPSETEAVVRGKAVSSYVGAASVVLNGNIPSFTSSQKKTEDSFVSFSPLDSLGRAGVAFGCIGLDIMPPSGSRGSIQRIWPSGWNQRDGGYPGIINSTPPLLYNRCHLLAHQLAGVEEEINLITGTRYLNEIGMKQYEDKVANYIQNTGNHVLYRATPVFKGDNKLASGVQLEAYSIEDSGNGICFNVYCYNVQPGVDLNYLNGDNSIGDTTFEVENIFPFAVYNANDSNPDLILEMNKHLQVLFADQKKSNPNTYNSMMNEINAIANEARAVDNYGENSAQSYIKMKEYQYEYFKVLKSYIPLLLEKEPFFKKAFS